MKENQQLSKCLRNVDCFSHIPKKILEKLVATAHLEKWDPNFTGRYFTLAIDCIVFIARIYDQWDKYNMLRCYQSIITMLSNQYLRLLQCTFKESPLTDKINPTYTICQRYHRGCKTPSIVFYRHLKTRGDLQILRHVATFHHRWKTWMYNRTENFIETWQNSLSTAWYLSLLCFKIWIAFWDIFELHLSHWPLVFSFLQDDGVVLQVLGFCFLSFIFSSCI